MQESKRHADEKRIYLQAIAKSQSDARERKRWRFVNLNVRMLTTQQDNSAEPESVMPSADELDVLLERSDEADDDLMLEFELEQMMT